MKRRGFLKGLLAAPAVPLAGELGGFVSSPPPSMSPAWGHGLMMQANEPPADFLARRAKELRKALAAPPRRDGANRPHVHGLDPDIAALKAFSPQYKMRLQVERYYQRAEAESRSYLQRELDQVLEQLGPLGRAMQEVI